VYNTGQIPTIDYRRKKDRRVVFDRLAGRTHSKSSAINIGTPVRATLARE
jgi:hypothetical protein